jgi:hypothetical protein
MEYIIHPNPEPPHNLCRTFPNFRDPSLEHLTEKEALEFIIGKLKTAGVITGEYWIIDEVDLPGGSVNDENDKLFGAWEMKDGQVTVNMSKARELGLA